MSSPKDICIKDFAYPLPDERIAKYPLPARDRSKLLVWRGGEITDSQFFRLSDYVPQGTLMVFNNTRVIRARLHFRKATGALIEIFCLEPHTPHDYQLSFAARGRCTWTCLVGNLKKWKEGRLEQTVTVGGKTLTLTAERLGESGTGHEIAFDWGDGQTAFSEVLEAIGELPIPPYLNRATEEKDLTTYQTVYSKIKGSVAAPTAGLHFTPAVLADLDSHGVERAEITLHVGAGTFKPVKSERIGGHGMHAEWVSISRETVERLLAHGGQCIAVGTTSVRSLESLYYVGVMLLGGDHRPEEELHVPQWLPYETENGSRQAVTTEESLRAVLRYLDDHGLNAVQFSTQIIIAPGYDFHIVSAMVTNFHQPQSTLLLLVSAFVGGRWREIYDHALAAGYRFLSYGDSSLLMRGNG